MFVDLLVAFGGLHTFGNHRLVAHEQKSAGGRFVIEAGHEDGGCFHIDRQGTDFFEVFFELGIVLPHAPIGGVDGSGPIVAGVVSDSGGDGFLERERRKRRHLGRKVVVACAFAADCRDGKDEVTEFCAVFDASAFAEEEHGFWMDRAEQVHDRGCGGAAHAEIDNRNASGRCAHHRAVFAVDRHAMPLREKFYVAIEIGEQDVVAKIL